MNSDKKIRLKPHQLIPVEYMKKNSALILYHSTGSGKTVTSLMAMTQHSDHLVIIGPKSSKKAFTDEIKRLKINPSVITMYSYQKIKLELEKNLDILQGCSCIIDEAHNLRNETTKNLTLISALGFANRVMLLTATPIINYPNDIAVLVNIVRKKDILPTDQRIFNNMYYDEDRVILQNEDILKEKFVNSISYYRTIDTDNYPISSTVYHEVEMNKEQIDIYGSYIKKYLYDDQTIVANPSTIFNIDLSMFDKKKKNFFLNATRQLSNTIDGDETFPKIQNVFNVLKKGPFPAVVYSNFLENGIFCMAILLEKANISYQSITGSTASHKINHIVEKYNTGDYQVLLISSAGSESLDLKCTRQVHIMEPHWNESRITQVIGRAVRYQSHASLPKKDRHVSIMRWVSVFPKSILNESADQHLIELSKRKDEMSKHYEEMISSSSIEKNWYSMKRSHAKKKKKKRMIQKGGGTYMINRLKYSQLSDSLIRRSGKFFSSPSC